MREKNEEKEQKIQLKLFINHSPMFKGINVYAQKGNLCAREMEIENDSDRIKRRNTVELIKQF